jgi:hypothetical protein
MKMKFGRASAMTHFIDGRSEMISILAVFPDPTTANTGAP